jgi:hypothetical protein
MDQFSGGAFFSNRNKTSEYSEIYREQLTSEHILPYNYRSSTLPGISRNISRLLRQCRVCIMYITQICFIRINPELIKNVIRSLLWQTTIYTYLHVTTKL